METPLSNAEKITETKRLLDMYNRDLADAAEGTSRMSAEDEERTRETVAKLEKELEDLLGSE